MGVVPQSSAHTLDRHAWAFKGQAMPGTAYHTRNPKNSKNPGDSETILRVPLPAAGLVGDDPLREGFVQALLLILFSEIGDKTFFIAVLLALQQPKSAVFTGTFGALAVMTVISGAPQKQRIVQSCFGLGSRMSCEAIS